jgi:predicted transcriptional regulator
MSDVVARSTARAVLMVVVTSPYPLSQPVIAASVNVSERQTQRALAQLTEANKLKREHREGEGRRNCLYKPASRGLRAGLRSGQHTACAFREKRLSLLPLFCDCRSLSREEIAMAAAVPKRTLQRMLNRLVADGQIIPLRQSGLGQRGWVYRLAAAS